MNKSSLVFDIGSIAHGIGLATNSSAGAIDSQQNRFAAIAERYLAGIGQPFYIYTQALSNETNRTIVYRRLRLSPLAEALLLDARGRW